MGWNYTPDGPFNFPNVQPNNNSPLREAFESFMFFKELETKISKEDKEKKEKSKNTKASMPKLSLSEAWAMVMIFGFPVVYGQLFLLQYFQKLLNATFPGGTP